MTSAERIEELHEDIEVAIQEFLDRHPQTSPQQIRHALLMVGRGAYRVDRRAPRLLALTMLFLLGVGLGAALL